MGTDRIDSKATRDAAVYQGGSRSRVAMAERAPDAGRAEAGTVQNWEGNVLPLTVCKGHAVENGDLFGGGE